jgi:hypothetical protein
MMEICSTNGTSSADNESTTTFEYFAIASMMNPTSIQKRGITPLKSQPAILLDYKLVFFGSMGYAEAIPCSPDEEVTSSEFHGVVHTVTQHDLNILNEIEHLYIPTKAIAQLYDGTKISVIVYCRPTEKQDTTKGIPQERYLNIMIEGAIHYGVKPEYIESLKKLEKEPRPKANEFLSFGPLVRDKHPIMTLEDVFNQDGQDGRPLCATVNGKVLQIQDPTPERIGLFRNMRKKLRTAALEDFLPKVIYDPMYGIPNNRNDCTREHAAYLEHLVVKRLGQNGAVVIGYVEQTYKET